ncbi:MULTISPECIES: 1,2-phenylacetyl-CoA epoxidase subunit PaaE [unclassified Marinobacterium]|uniref:1,2-phenylacetyl-CoA epoxidase subunit PaaE n=1 Tax=unclassified Marinobacterium TaxID=2644139 RepID=UPI001568DF85|nr:MULTISPECIES: 1,2-phenylacetyl-CoA epoxidase subunit PaaE [unclassified Marinobacterium]NRP52962.1 1,2-phenylacetyl-CoA epoxidase, subunit E [Marinobacterium sp. xm-v-242]NRP77543.1 1,2-phenylacetyl-CoA epoxidase, subunit E [Marinobacterium sp. xm-m-383]
MSNFHRLKIADRTEETRDSVSLAFEVPCEIQERFRFNQGQYLTLKANINNEEVRRSYSICSGVHDNELRVAVKRVPDGLFSNFANDQLAIGDEIDVMEPMGHFYTDLNEERSGNYLLMAAGSGITPILSQVKTILRSEPKSRVTLIYGNRATGSTMFKDQLEDLKNSYMGRLNLIFIFSREQQDIDLYNGHIDAEKCEALFSKWIDVKQLTDVFICGPQSMTETVSESLIKAGVAKQNVHFELFGTTQGSEKRAQRTEAAERATHLSSIEIIRDGHVKQFDLAQNTQNILDAANEQGAELPYSCKAGVCSTCKCKVVEGQVEMDVSIGLEDYEVKEGFVLSCQSYPISDKVVLDFDQI